jgi:hypothetical protein
MNSEKLQPVQDENDLTELQNTEVDSSVEQTEEVLPEGAVQDENDLTELQNSEVDSSVEQTEEVLSEGSKPGIELKPGCVWYVPCPTTGGILGCLVCF